MTDLAVIKTGGKQYLVKSGDLVKVEKIRQLADKKSLVFDDILSGKKVTATIASQGKQLKIRIFKYKPKTNYRRTRGHRQAFTELKIEKIS